MVTFPEKAGRTQCLAEDYDFPPAVLDARIVGRRFNYSPAYVRLLRHLFMQGKIDFAEPVPEGKTRRRRVDAAIREKIKNWRAQKLSAGEITECLSEDGHEISVRTVERAQVPDKSKM